MTGIIWVVFGVLLALWTAAVWLASAVTGWAAEALRSGTASGSIKLPDVIEQLPEGLKAWIPGDLLELLPPLVASLQRAVEMIETSLPWAGEAVSWLVPLLWVGWFVVTLGLFVVAFVAHLLVRRATRPAQPRPA
ncbi:MAG TPA: hypothetical protein VGD46_00985 [Rhizobacter sp.]